METRTITQTVPLLASPAQVFETYMTSAGHAAFTAQDASISAENGAPFSTYAGLIQGHNLDLVPGEKIVQTWKINGMDWPAGHESTLTLELFATVGGTRLEMTHDDIPLPLAAAMTGGWNQWYWEPLAKYFESHKGA